MASLVDLGYVEKVEDTNRLNSIFFPSKVGGKPAWLNLKDLPTPKELECPKCNEPCIFLLQIYASGEESKPETFHRTIFVFVCIKPECCLDNDNKNFLVFRCQLERLNDFYSYEPPDDKTELITAVQMKCNVCIVCGSAGNKHCSKCRKAIYCSKSHQILHWKSSHKNICSKELKTNFTAANLLAFEEYELVIESEELEVKVDDYVDAANQVENSNFLDDASIPELEAAANKETDKAFRKFEKRIKQNPDQVLRYEKNGDPLWVSSEYKPMEIPNCLCGAKRSFEFQIMPQLLNYLNVDKIEASLDWGTLAIYTCSENCVTKAYNPEFLWKQDFSK